MTNEVTCEDSDSASDIEFTSPPRKNIRTDQREESLSSAAERHRLDPYYLGEDASSGIVYYVSFTVKSVYTVVGPVGRRSNRTILSNSGLTEPFCGSRSNRSILSYLGSQDNFIFKIVLLDRFGCKLIIIRNTMESVH